MSEHEPMAARNHYGVSIAAREYNGERECPYPHCENATDWLVETDSGAAFFTCDNCSYRNFVYVRERQLFKKDVKESTIEAVEEKIGERL